MLSAAAGASTATALVVRQAVRVPIVDSISQPTLVATLPPVGWWLLTLITGAFAGALLGKWLAHRDAAAALRPLLLPGLANLAYIPGAISLVPFLSAFSGPLLDWLLVGSVAAAVWRAAEPFGLSFSPSANRVALAALVLYLFVGYRVQHSVGLTGDEPHYLLIVHSMLEDHDLQVADDYAGGSYGAFYTGKIGPHLAHGTGYSVHGVGLPLLLLPGYALLGLTGVLLTKALLGAVAVRELFRAVESLSGDGRAALVATVAFGVTVPGLFLLTAAYPELPVAVLSIAVFRRWISPAGIGSLGAAAWGLAFGLLLLFHIKFLTLTAVFVLGCLIYWPKRRWLVLAGTGVGLLSVLVFLFSLTGSWNPLASWGTQRVFWQGIPVGLAGLFFDQEAGLLPAAPIFVFALAALGSFSRSRPMLGFLVVAALGALALPAAAHPAWPGGASAPARYLFPALPLLAAVGAAVWRWDSGRGIVPWMRPLLLMSVVFAVYAATVPGQFLYLNQKDGTGRLWEALGTSWDLTHYLPSLLLADTRSVMMALVGVAGLVTLFLIQLFRYPLPLPPLVAVVFLVTMGIDFSWPGRVPETAAMHRMERLTWGVARHPTASFVSLPRARSLSYQDVLGLIDLPMLPARGLAEGESTDGWESASLRLPAGGFALEGTSRVEISVCNGEGCFATGHSGESFETRAGLARFHVRSQEPPTGLRLRVVRLEEDFVTALQTVRLTDDLTLHALDDHVYYEPTGFWVRASERARFALEGPSRGTAVLSLANGGVENGIAIERPDEIVRFNLGPFEARRIEILVPAGLEVFSVESASGFQPVEQDPTKLDHRYLGVLVTAPRR